MRNATQGTKQLGLEVDAELVDRIKAFAKGRGETLRKVVETALRRHMAYPPPVQPPPVPPPHPFPDSPPIAGAEVEPERTPTPAGKRSRGAGRGPGKVK